MTLEIKMRHGFSIKMEGVRLFAGIRVCRRSSASQHESRAKCMCQRANRDPRAPSSLKKAGHSPSIVRSLLVREQSDARTSR